MGRLEESQVEWRALAREWQDRLLRHRKPRPDGSYPVDLPTSS